MRRLFAFLVAIPLAMLGWTYWSAVADPVVRDAEMGLADRRARAPPIRAVLISDIHVA